ncbi:MAG: sulfatase-like hydrolase/transferase, partial [Bacteroidales bacterium]|jgi:phosphoglycerol transferase MdoB-like AlkP superfamily enzyme|nr:sulfatase-like hydrolase/transferase [Bacteroidales bacterium]
MKRYWGSVVKLVLFWLLFFAFTRLLFLLVYNNLLSAVPMKEIFAVFYHALRLDIATACYFLSIPLLIFVLQLCIRHRITTLLLRIIVIIELILASLITFAEIGIYGEWRSKLNYKALVYLRHPDEIFRTATSFQIIFFILGIIVLVVGFYLLYNRFVIRPPIVPQKKAFIKVPVCLLLTGGLCFTGMRGGINAIPITQSSAYFSHVDILNEAAVNTCWNIMLNIIDFRSLEDNNLFSYMDNVTADETVKQLQKATKDTTVSVLKKTDINIVVLLLESWTADVLELINGSNEITPHFSALAKEGLLFTHFYSNGHRSQQAICSILSGFPSIPNYDITNNHSKYKHLPSLAKVFKEKGYHTSFYFGGNLDYGNIRAFLLHANVDEIIEEKNINNNIPHGKLGIHDEYMLAYHRKHLRKERKPFFTILFTLSSHSPYDEPKNVAQLNWNTTEIKYLNAVKYTDYWLGRYFDSVKNQSWYDNTLFILVADHGHSSHIDRSYYETNYQHIPMLWYGNVLKEEFKGVQCDIIGSHVDIPETLLSQLGYNTSLFTWGRNMFNPYCNQYVYYEITKGFGWITPAGSYTYSPERETFFYYNGDETKKDTLLFTGKAYMHKLFKTYLSY